MSSASQDFLFKIICPTLIINESINSQSNSKIILEEIQLYEDFMSSIKQYLQNRYNDTIADLSQNLVNTKDTAVLIKEIISNPDYLELVVTQLNKQIRNLMKSIRSFSSTMMTNATLAPIRTKIQSLLNTLTQRISQSLTTKGWKGFLYSLGVYGFAKFVFNKFTEYGKSAESVLTFFNSGATDLLEEKIDTFSNMIINIASTTMAEFIGFFGDMVEVGKIFTDILSYIRRKLEVGNNLNLQNAPQTATTAESVGRIVRNVNTTADVGVDEIKKQAAKFGNKVDRDGRPPLIHKTASKNSNPNTLFNMGITEEYTALELAIMEGGHILEEDWKSNLKKMLAVGLITTSMAAAISTKDSYDKWMANVQQKNPQIAKQIMNLPDRPVSAVASPQGASPEAIGEPSDSRLAPSVSPLPQERPSTIAPETSPKPKKKPSMLLTNNPIEKLLLNTATTNGISGVELAAFMAQSAHETMSYYSMYELGDKEYFRMYDKKYAPEKASELGNTEVGDGYRYRGRGFIHLTGRYNYRKAGEELGLPLEQEPDLAADPKIAANIAVWFWKNRVVPKVTDFTDVAAVTKPINSGLNKLSLRVEKFNQYYDNLKWIENANKNTQTASLSEAGSSIRLGDLAEIKTNFEDADFWVWRRNTLERVGEPTKVFNPQHIGIKVQRTDILLPDYLYYLMQYLHTKGHFKKAATGSTNLVNITTNDIKNISFALNESNTKRIVEAIKKVKESEIVDLGKAREEDKLKKFHKDFMGKVKSDVEKKINALEVAHEQGLFDDLPIGSRFTLPKGASYKVLGHSMQASKTDQLPRHQLEFRNKFNFGPAKFIEVDGKFFRPMVYTEEVAGEMAGSNSAFELDKLVNFETGEKRYTKFTGPRKVSEKAKTKQVKGKEPLPPMSKPSKTGFQKHPYTGRLVGESVGYKVMAYDPTTAMAYSLADDSIKIPLVIGKDVKMSGNGLYLSNSENFVKTYYSGLTDKDEILIKFDYNPSDIISGNDRDNESEFTVKNAKIVGFKVISENISNNLFNIIKENMSVTATEVARIAKEKGLEPGSDEWFKHWFSLPYMIDRNKPNVRTPMGIKK